MLSQKTIDYCPVLQPTQQQFQNFTLFASKVENQYSKQFGMVKVVPPKSWKPRSKPYDDSLNSLQIKNPIEQNPEGKMGIYEFKHIGLPSISYVDYIKQYESKELVVKDKTSQQIQQLFWKTLPYSPPVYGADILATLMDQQAKQWNLNSLNSILQKGLSKTIKGVNTSYCYIGSWKSLFCWHKEDLDLQAINFLHFGKSKFWYCIQPDDSNILQSESQKNFFRGFDRCSQYLRHKTCLINPYILKKKYPNLKVTKIQQKPGQFILAFSGAYHCGFNFGINVAEAVNYATFEWLPKLKQVQYCNCKKSSVKINLQAVITKLLQDNEYKNHPTVLQLKAQIEKQKSTQFQLNQQQIFSQSHDNNKKLDQLNNDDCQLSFEQQQNEAIQKKCKKIKKHKQNQNANHEHRTKIKRQKKKDTLDWVQCENCNFWHILSSKIEGIEEMHFTCTNLGLFCQNKPLSFPKMGMEQ